MHKFIKNILFFFWGLWLIAVVLDICFSYQLANTEAWDNQVWGKMIRSEMDNDLLILGSSRAFRQYDPRIIDSVLHTNCYNLGKEGSNIDFQCLSYQIYKKYKNAKPKTIVLDIYNASLTLSDPFFCVLLYPYIWNEYIWECINHTQYTKPHLRFIPLIRYYSRWDFLNKNMHSVHSMLKGYQGFDENWDASDFNNVERIKLFAEDKAISILDTFLSECAQDSISVILVHSPIYYKYWEKFPDSTAMWNLYRSFSAKYNVPILDYSKNDICKDTIFFSEALHLNRTGAELFSRKLAHDLDSMGYGNH